MLYLTIENVFTQEYTISKLQNR